MTKRQKGILYTSCALIFIGCFFAVYWHVYGRFHQKTNDAYVKGNITLISSRVPGYITACNVKDNQFVQAGTSLVSLDDRQFKVQLDSARARLDQAKAGLASLHASMKLNHDKVALTRAKVRQAIAELANKEQHLKRIRALKGNNYASQSLLDGAETAVKSASASLDAARAAHRSAMDQMEVIKTNQKKAEALVALSETDVEKASLELSYTVIRAPVDGIITNRNINQGMFVSAGRSLLSLVPLDSVWIEANFKETQLKNLRPGQPVNIRVDAYPGQMIKGKVDSIAPGAGSEFALLPPDNATGNFTKVVQRVPVKITIIDLGKVKKPLYPGLSVNVDVNTRGG